MWGLAHSFFVKQHAGLIEEDLTESVIGAYYDVYNRLGFGFLEHVYAAALERELLDRRHRVSREVSVGVLYKVKSSPDSVST